MRLRLVFVTFLSLGLFAGTAMAQEEDRDADALAAFKRGIKYFQDGEYNKASAAFREANDIKFNWKLLYNIGQSEAAAKQYGLALQVFEEYIARGGDDVPTRRRDEVLGEIKRMREMVGAIEVEGPSGATILVDGVERDRIPISGPVLVSAGVSHEVKVMLGEEEILVRSVRVTGQQTFKLDANPKGADDAVQANDAAPTDEGGNTSEGQPEMVDSGKNMRTAGWITLGIGAAGLIMGGATGIAALSKGNSLEEEFGLNVPDSEEDQVNTMENLAMASTVGLIAGGVLVTTGAILLIIGSKKKETPVSVTPVISDSVAGISIGGRF